VLRQVIKAVFLGIVQGITEWLPVSSTGHMLLIERVMALGMSEAFKSMFFVVIQLGSILAVAVLYFERLSPFSRKKSRAERQNTWRLWGKVLLGCLPAGIVGILFEEEVERLFFESPFIIALALIGYGIAFLLMDGRRTGAAAGEAEQVTAGQAFAIGCFQVLSLIPGTSRSGSTILGGMIAGVSRAAAAEFSFFMALPVMLGAGMLKLLSFGWQFTPAEAAVLLAGMGTAFFVSLMVIRLLMDYVRRHSFRLFGWYRIILGAVVLALFVW